MKRQQSLFILVLLLFSGLFQSHARLMSVLTYQQLFDRSDLVVIATPVSKTMDTAEKTSLPNVYLLEPEGTKHQVRATGVETSFHVCLVLKGSKDIKQLVLHHYRQDPPNKNVLNGPMLVSFDPQDQAKYSYIMFLVREEDGRYAPTGGQTDPAYKSVSQLPVD
jgi:hypothetical protein